jgi:hypothetical protein
MSWFERRQHIPFLITGHPRTGTWSASAACRQLGIDIRGEEVGRYGISSWLMAVDDRHNCYGDDTLTRSRYRIAWDWLILVVRDPKQAVPSVMVENERAPISYAFRRKHIRKQMGIDLDDTRNPFHAAILSIVCWTEIILRQNPSLSFRIEDEQRRLVEFVVEKLQLRGIDQNQKLPSAWINAEKLYDGIKYAKPSVPDDAWLGLDAALRERVACYCSRFGYADPTQ